MARRKHQKNDELSYRDITLCALMAFAGVWFLYPRVEALLMSDEEREAIEASVYYPGCDEVREEGKAPLYRGDPGYRSGMDGDDDGIACEPY